MRGGRVFFPDIVDTDPEYHLLIWPLMLLLFAPRCCGGGFFMYAISQGG